jgi:hypothetical protein
LRSPIGPEVRHTKKSAAAAAERAERASASATAALQRLKSSRQPSAAPSPAAQSPEPVQSRGLPDCQPQQPVQPAVQQGSQQPPAPFAQQHGVPHASMQAAEDTPAHTPALDQSPAPPQPQPLPLPADSNAALVAEVRQLRSRLLSSLQKHAPEGGAGLATPARGGGLGSAAADLSKLWRWRQPGASQADAWRLSAVPAAPSSPALSPLGSAATTAPLAADPSSPRSGAWHAHGATVLGSSRKYRLSDFGSSSSWGSGQPSIQHSGTWDAGRTGDATPVSLFSGGGSVAPLSSLGLGSSAPPSRSGAFAMDPFEQHTEALRLRLAGL